MFAGTPRLLMLTNRQQQLLDFLHEYYVKTGIMPSTREIQNHFGFSSQTAAVSHLKALEKKGVIQRLPGKARAVIFAEGFAPESKRESNSIEIPLYGHIAAGMAEEASQEADEVISVDPSSMGLSRNAKVFALKVRGDSMIDAHITEGDLVILEHKEPRNRDVVAALIDGETTLKRFVMEGSRPFLRAENEMFPDLIPAQELIIQGVMVGLLRTGGWN